MVKRSKLYERVLAGSQNIRFEEFVMLLEWFGFILERIRGSHYIFAHPDIPDLLSIQPRKDGKAKPYQIRQFLKLVEAHDLQPEGE